MVSQFSFDFIAPNIITNQKGRGAKELEQLMKHFSTKIQEVTSNVVIAKKNEKQYVRLQLSIPGTQRGFLDKFAPDIDGLADEPM